MNFNISTGNQSDRITITLDSGKKAENVKTHSGWVADLACWAGFAKKILDTDGNAHVVNLHSLGKAWLPQTEFQALPLTNKIKDLAAIKFFLEVENSKRQEFPEFIKELKTFVNQGHGNSAQLEINAMRRLKNKPYLDTIQERIRLYDRMKNALNDIKDDEWQKKINKHLPPVEKIEKDLTKLNAIIDELAS